MLAGSGGFSAVSARDIQPFPSMTTATHPSLALPFDRVKMDERKRSLAPDVDDQAPRPKRIKEENGNAPRMSAENEAQVEVCCYHHDCNGFGEDQC